MSPAYHEYMDLLKQWKILGENGPIKLSEEKLTERLNDLWYQLSIEEKYVVTLETQ